MTAHARTPPNHLIPNSPAFGNDVLTDLAAEFGTPTFVYDLDLLSSAFEELRGFLPGDSRILYSVKANPNLAILRRLAELGAGFEVASAGELMAVQRAGIDPGAAVFVGPGKRTAELAEAIDQGLGWLVVDSALEYGRALSVRRDAGRSPFFAVRLNPGTRQSNGSLLRMAGHTPFGMTEPEALELLRQASPDQPIEGFHGYLGTHILGADTIIANTAVLLDVAARLQARSAARFRLVDLGGGFGTPQYDRDEPLDGGRLRAGLAELVDGYRRANPWTEVVAFESGRFLTARAGVLLCGVVDCKDRGGELFVILDGGVNSVGGRDGYAGARPMPLRLLAEGDETTSATFCGPLCTPMDRVAARVLTPRPQPGQVVALFLAGAYAYSASPGLFLSHGYCAEVGVTRGRARLLRPRQDMRAFLDSQSV